MPTITNGNYVNSPIENTTMLEKLRDGSLYAYSIQAVDGYLLHDNRVDDVDLDGNIIPWFKSGSTTVSKSYDFQNTVQGTYTYIDENNMEVTIPVTKIGMYEFYTVPANIVPENQTMRNDTEHEVM